MWYKLYEGCGKWFFGEDLRNIPELGSRDPQDYGEFICMLNTILSLYKSNPDSYYKIGLNALSYSIPKVGIHRLLKEYYPDLVKTETDTPLLMMH